MSGNSPYRGLLLYYGLGVGKTCSALAISETINTLERVIFISKTALEANFTKQIKECGSEYMRHMNHWVFCYCDKPNEHELAYKLGITDNMIEKNGGAFLIDYSKSIIPNYSFMSIGMKTRLNQQIDIMISNRFSFIHIDGNYQKKISQSYFDNSVIIIDEIHNLINTMTTGNSSRSEVLYNYLMNATNSKFIFLSATPLINNIFETSRLFNILRGYMPFFEFRFKVGYDVVINYDDIKYNLQLNKFVDQVSFNRIKKSIKITRNPNNFITSSSKNYQGIIYSPKDNIKDEEFKDVIIKIIHKYGYEYTILEGRETALPEEEEKFERQFYNVDLNKMKKKELFKHRIAGLTSYYGYLDPLLFPQIANTYIINVPMSNYQANLYEKVRHDEISKEKKQRKQSEDEQFPSTFKIKSRFACSIAFPEEISSDDKDELLTQLDSMDIAETDTINNNIIIDEIDNLNKDNNIIIDETINEIDNLNKDKKQEDKLKLKKERDKLLKNKIILFFNKNKHKYLDIHNGSLEKYSPKYLQIIKNIVRSPGSILVYSQFNTLHGLYIFSLALEQTNEYQPLILQKTGDQWQIDYTTWDINKKRFIFYTGNTANELSSIYIKLFNSQWDALDANCSDLKEDLKQKFGDDQNLYGKFINIFMTTKKGTEGIDLKHVRQVHIMEPYWQHVLMEQVIGRAVRTNSHIRLPEKERNVEVFIYITTFTQEQIDNIGFLDIRRDICKYNNDILGKYNKVITTDESLYILAKRKEIIIKECQFLIKESAFDCSLFYHDNIKMIDNANLRCLDFPSKNRNDYIYVPNLEDTEEIMELSKDKIISVTYIGIIIKGLKYYYPSIPDSSGNTYIYNDTLFTKVRLPKPLGKVSYKDGKRIISFYKKK